ncbi:Folate-binding protein 1 [Cardamine amara subsp. amara]|uniref:Folate-binding protein 1 n=1 Tax=Cardamine amara subsp. amara TaxID=228776 RepID=A0ABD1BGU9_CARAN
MGNYLTKTVFLVLLLHLLISSSCGAAAKPSENGVCISKGGRFSPYESEGKPPKSADREFKDLNMCKAFHGKTCCSASQMQSVSSAVKNLATFGESVKDCSDLFELLECSICNPNVGIQSGPPRICASFCDRVFEACSDAYFSSDASKKVIIPCGANEDIICGKASKWESNGTAFCDAMGFTVQTEEPCYGSKASLEPVMESGSSEETQKFVVWFQDLQQPVREMISWAVIITGSFLYRGLIDMRAMRLGVNRNGNA